MRKILFFLAAICCMMFVSVPTAKAEVTADGAVIFVNGVEVMDADVNDILNNGEEKVQYDAATHTLFLHNESVNITGGIVIDASANGGFTVTIKVEGTCLITNEDAVALWFKKGNGLIIEGDETGYLSVKSKYKSGGSHHAIYCGSDESSWADASVFTIKGGVYVYAENVESDGYHSAIRCRNYAILKSKLTVSTHSDTWPINTYEGNPELDHVTFINQKGDAYAYPFENGFPIWVNGVQMSDGLTQLTDPERYYLSGSEMTALGGSPSQQIIYDPTNRILTIDGGVELVADNGEAAIVINDDAHPSLPITIIRGTTFIDQTTKIQGKGAIGGIIAKTPTVIDANGCELFINSEEGIALDAQSEVTLQNSNLDGDEDAQIRIFGDKEKGIFSSNGLGKLNIGRVEISLYGKNEVCDGLASITVHEGEKLQKEDDYEFTSNSLVEKGTTNIVKGTQIWLEIAGWYFDVAAVPEDAGNFIYRDASDNIKTLPYLFKEDQNGSVEVVAKDGWTFLHWQDTYNNANPREVSLLTSNKNQTRYAQFSRNIVTNETFYGIRQMDRVIDVYSDKLRKHDWKKVDAVPEVGADTWINRAVAGNGKLYAIEHDDMNSKDGLISFEFDGAAVSNTTGIVALQKKYHPVRAIAFNDNDNKIYAIAYDNDDLKDVFIVVDPASENEFSKLADVPGEYNYGAVAMVFAGPADLQVLVCEMEAKLYSYDISTSTSSLLGTLEGIMTGYSYVDYAMVISEETGEQILKVNQDLYLISHSPLKADWISGEAGGVALFAGAKRYAISAKVKAGQESWGTAEMTGMVNDGAFLEGDKIELFAQPYSDYYFAKWDDENTDNPREFTVGTEDKVFTAVFEEKNEYFVETSSNNDLWGSATIKYYGASADIHENEEITLIAQPVSGFFRFVKWSDENTDNPRKWVVTQPNVFEAIFEELPTHTLTVASADDVNGKAEIDGYTSPATLAEGMEVKLIATPLTLGYVFTQWQDGVRDNPRIITVGDADATFTASFDNSSPAYTIDVAVASGQGYMGKALLPGNVTSAEYVEGAEIQIKAVPTPGHDEYVFDEWDDHNTDNPRTITVTGAATYTAVFKELPTHDIVLLLADGQEFWGTVAFESGYYYAYGIEGKEFVATATPMSDKYEFVEWNDHNTDNPRTFTIGATDLEFTAIFQKVEGVKHNITVAVESGQEAFGEVNINGSGTTGNFTEGSNITLNAIATDPSYEFDQWADDPSAPATRTIEVGTADATYTASFKLKPVMYTISVDVDDASHGDVWLTGGLKTGDFEAGSEVTLFVSHLDGFVFEKWNDDNTDNPRTVTVTADASYTAIFKAGDAYTIELKVATGQELMGDVSFPDVPGLIAYDFAKDAEVKIKAEAKPGYAFDKWDDDDTNAERTVTVTENKDYTAFFKDADKVEIEVAVAEGQTGWGTVKIVPGDVTKGEFAIGANITLVATAADGYKFVKWDDENTLKDRVITVAEAKKFIASFEKLPEVKKYPVYIGGVQLTNAVENLAVFAGNSDFPALKYGAIQLDAENKVLTLSGAVIETTGDVVGLVLGDETASGKLEIVVIGDCKVTSVANAIELKKFSGATVKCEGTGAKLTVKSDAKGIALDGTALTLNDVALQVVGGTFGIVGTTEYEVLTVVGGAVQVEGTASGSIVDITLVMNYVELPAGYSNNETDHRVDKGAAVAKDNVVFGSYPKLTAKGVEEGSGRFKLVSDDDSFYDTGWFKTGTQVTITAEAEDNFEFVRWMDDPNWKDKDLAMKAKREPITVTGDQEFTALFYHDVKSSATWYGVSEKEGKFLSFSFEDRGKEFVKATTSASSVKAGDYVEGNWVTVEASNKIKVREFDEIEDGEAMPDAEELEKKAPADLTDIAYDLMSREMFGVAGNKLYSVDLESGEAEELGTFDYDGYPKTAAAIAVDAKRTIYILAQGTPGALFTVKDIADKKVSLEAVGDEKNHGELDVDVTADEQAIAFDHVTGELFWGAKDYLRLLDLEETKAHIVGDLGQTGGAQGFIKSMHRKDKKVTVRVQFADGQDGFGTISITPGSGAKADVIVGTKVTLVAKPNAGYKFLYWRPTSGTGDDITEAEYTFSPKKNVTYEAHFKKMDEGFENVSDELNPAEKMIINGQLFILRNGKLYNAAGVLVK